MGVSKKKSNKSSQQVRQAQKSQTEKAAKTKQKQEEEAQEEDSSSSSDEEDDLLAMMQFVGDGSSETLAKKKRNEQKKENESVKATREVTRQYRMEKAKKENVERKNELKKLTLQNLAAASSMWADIEEEEEELAAAKAESETGSVLRTEEEAQRLFSTSVGEAKKLILDKKLEDAVERLKQGLTACTAFPSKALWKGTIEMTLGSTLLRLGDIRDAIKHFTDGLRAVRAGHSDSFDSYPLQKQILAGLVRACNEIGRASDASGWQKQLDTLNGKNQKETDVKDDGLDLENYDYTSLPGDLKTSLDQALEAARDGQFGYLRAVLHAFRSGRGQISVRVIGSYPHSQTGATPLMLACAQGELDLVKALLYVNVPIGAVANNGMSAVEWAARFNQPEAVRLLLEAGAIFDSALSPETLQSWSPQVQSAIATFVEAKKKATPAQQQVKVDGFETVVKGKKKNGKPAAKGNENRSTAAAERELQEWEGSKDGAKALEEESHQKDWDQFKANEDLGVKTQGFDENLYTTKLDVDSIPAELRAQAEALARNIETNKTVRDPLGDDYDEEAAYSAVLRDSMTVQDDDDGWTDVAVRNKSKNKTKQNNNASSSNKSNNGGKGKGKGKNSSRNRNSKPKQQTKA